MRFIFWQNIISPHQAFVIKALAEQYEVHLVVERLSDPAREAQGWQQPDLGKTHLHLLMNSSTLDLYAPQTHHFFSGIKSYKSLHQKFLEVSERQKVNIIAESPIQMGILSPLRAILYRLHHYRYGERINYIFAIGDLGVRWFRRAGFSAQQVKKFQYTIDLPTGGVPIHKPHNDGKCNLIFIGQLIHRKGVDNLLKAVLKGDTHRLRLHIIGDGPRRENLQKFVDDNNLKNTVTFLGTFTNDAAMQYLSEKADYLVLPSRFDGWGAVINEALARGIKVITNNKCGASSIIVDNTWGYVYSENKPDELANILNAVVKEPKELKGSQKRLLAEKYCTIHQESVLNSFLRNFT